MLEEVRMRVGSGEMILLLLLLPLLSWASPRCIEEPMSSVMIIVNVEDTLATGVYSQDTDGDGLKVWEELKIVVDSIADSRNETRCHFCQVQIKYSSHNADYPQAIHIDGMYYEADRDTSLGWSELPGESPAVTSTADYLQKQIQQCRQAAYIANGAYPKYYATLNLPRIIRPNSEAPNNTDALQVGAPSLNSSTILVKSVQDAIEIFTPANGDTAIPNASFTGGWYTQAGSYAYIAKTNKAKRGFVAGDYFHARYATTSYDDTLEQYVIVTSLDAITDNGTCDLVRKAYRGMGQAWEADGTPNYFGVAQGVNDSSALNSNSTWYAWSLQTSQTNKIASYFAKSLRSVFGLSSLLWCGAVDSLFFTTDTLISATAGTLEKKSVYFGYNGGRTLAAGDSAIFYLTSASYYSNAIGTDILYNTEIPLADGTFGTSQESWNVYTWGQDTTLRSGTSDDQTLLMEMLDPNGMNATCAVGNAREVTVGLTAASSFYVPEGMYTPNMNFAEVSEMAFGKYQSGETPTKGLNIAIGWPLLYWRPATEFVETCTITGNCSEKISYVCTVPDNIDSLNFWIATAKDTIDTIFVVTSGEQATFSFGGLWTSDSLVELVRSGVDGEGYYHSKQLFPQ